MIINRKVDFDPELKAQLQAYVYDVVGYIQDVYNELPNVDYQQLFSYMIGTSFPIDLLVNFHRFFTNLGADYLYIDDGHLAGDQHFE